MRVIALLLAACIAPAPAGEECADAQFDVVGAAGTSIAECGSPKVVMIEGRNYVCRQGLRTMTCPPPVSCGVCWFGEFYERAQ